MILKFILYFDKEIMISTPKTADTWPPRDHSETFALENG